MEKSLGRVADEAKKQRVALHFARPDPALPDVMTAGGKIQEILDILVHNAVAYNKERGRVDVALKRENDGITVAVADQGLGIPQDQQQDVFKRFFRARNVISTVMGTGIGLYIAKALLEDLGGRIWFDSQEGRGSTFSVFVPFASPKNEEQGTKGE